MKKTVVSHNCDEMLFERLKRLRLEVAQESGYPAYRVFHDTTLAELAAAMPSTRKEFQAIKGIGPSKTKKYSEIFIEEIKKYKAYKEQELLHLSGNEGEERLITTILKVSGKKRDVERYIKAALEESVEIKILD